MTAQRPTKYIRAAFFSWWESWQHVVSLSLIVLLATFLRARDISAPLADWHSWRQADTASVTREFVKHGHSLFIPRYHDLSNIPNGLENPEGYRMVEFPLVNGLVASLLKWQPSWDLVTTSRAVSIVFSLGTLVGLYGLTWTLSRRWFTATLAAGVFAVLPYSIFYSRAILPEPAMVSMQVLGLWAFAVWIEGTGKNRAKWRSMGLFFLSAILTALSLLLKPTAVFIAPVFIALSIWKFGWRTFFTPSLWLFAALVVLPTWGWRTWIQNFPAGIPASDWLLNGNGIRLRPAWWRWLFFDRIGSLILGVWGTLFVLTGLSGKNNSSKYPFDLIAGSWAAGMFAYLAVFATGNVQHDYYQIMLTPILCLLIARGIVWLLDTAGKNSHRFLVWAAVPCALLLMLSMSWYQIQGYFSINHPEIVAAGRATDRLTPPDAKVIAPYGGDTAFLFQTNRTGWPVSGSVEKFMGLGATHYVTTTKDNEAQQLKLQYVTLEETQEYVLLDLTQPLATSSAEMKQL